MWSTSITHFLLDFDHWLHLSDIFKTAIGSKPDVTFSLTYPLGMDNIETRGKLPLLACSKDTGG